MSIDPRTLTCLVCEDEHDVLQGQGKPVVVILSDQNFVSAWPGTAPDKCVVVIRILNPSLMELMDLMLEIFDRKVLPAGSVVLAGSVSHLQGVGVSLYTREWTRFVCRVEGRWQNVRVCPLIPLITDTCPGGVGREVSLLAVWLLKVYGDSSEGLKDVWRLFMRMTFERMRGGSPFPLWSIR